MKREQGNSRRGAVTQQKRLFALLPRNWADLQGEKKRKRQPSELSWACDSDWSIISQIPIRSLIKAAWCHMQWNRSSFSGNMGTEVKERCSVRHLKLWKYPFFPERGNHGKVKAFNQRLSITFSHFSLYYCTQMWTHVGNKIPTFGSKQKKDFSGLSGGLDTADVVSIPPVGLWFVQVFKFGPVINFLSSYQGLRVKLESICRVYAPQNVVLFSRHQETGSFNSRPTFPAS